MKSYLLDIERKPPISSTGDKRRLHMSERTVPFTDEFFNRFISSLTQEDFIHYSNCEDLRVALADQHRVNPENIFIGAGSDYVLSAIFNAFVSSNSTVIMPEAHFPMYDVYLAQNQGKSELMKYKLDEHGNLALDFDSISLSGIKDLSLVVMGNPNSPVGDALPYDKIMSLASLGVPLVLDQAYGDFGKTEVPIEAICQNVIFVNSFSKSAGAAGCRIGYAIADAQTIKLLNAFRQMFEITNVSRKFALFLLENKFEVLSYVNSIIKERNKLKEMIPYVQYGNWIHLPSDVILPNDWEFKQSVKLPEVSGEFSRVSIFEGLSEYVK